MRDYFERLLGLPPAIPAPPPSPGAAAQPPAVSGLYNASQDDIEEIISLAADETGEGGLGAEPVREGTSFVSGGEPLAPAAISPAGLSSMGEPVTSSPTKAHPSSAPASPSPLIIPGSPLQSSSPLPAPSVAESSISRSVVSTADPVSLADSLQHSQSQSKTAAVLDQVLQWIAAGDQHAMSPEPQPAPPGPESLASPAAPPSLQTSEFPASSEFSVVLPDPADGKPLSSSLPLAVSAIPPRGDDAPPPSLAVPISSAPAVSSAPTVTIGTLHVSIEAPPPAHPRAPLHVSPPSPPSSPFVPPSLPDRSRMSRHYLSPR